MRRLEVLSHLADLKLKHLLEIRRLTDEQQVKGPAPAEIGHDDGVDGHGREELPPGSVEFLPRGESRLVLTLRVFLASLYKPVCSYRHRVHQS